MTEKDVNKMLIDTLRVSKILEKMGKTELAKKLLVFSSSLADLQLNLMGRKTYKVFCKCGRSMNNGNELEFYNRYGQCYMCEKIQTDCAIEQRKENMEGGELYE